MPSTIALVSAYTLSGWIGALIVMRVTGTTRVKDDAALGTQSNNLALAQETRSNPMPDDLPVDPDALRDQVREKYREVAVDPRGEFHFHTGRRAAAHLGSDRIARELGATVVREHRDYAGQEVIANQKDRHDDQAEVAGVEPAAEVVGAELRADRSLADRLFRELRGERARV